MNNHDAPDETLVGYDTLTERQKQALAAYRAPNVPAEWFIGAQNDEGQVSVVAVGDTWVWSLLLGEDMDETMEANFDEAGWSTGIEI